MFTLDNVRFLQHCLIFIAIYTFETASLVVVAMVMVMVMICRQTINDFLSETCFLASLNQILPHILVHPPFPHAFQADFGA